MRSLFVVICMQMALPQEKETESQSKTAPESLMYKKGFQCASAYV